MNIRYCRAALFSINEIDNFFEKDNWKKYLEGSITYDEFCINIRKNIKSQLNSGAKLGKLLKYWNPNMFEMICKYDLVNNNKKSNDLMKTLFSYIYRATCNSEYGNMFGYVSRVTQVPGKYEKEIKVKKSYNLQKKRKFYRNPTICYTNNTLYFVAYIDDTEKIRKISVAKNDYIEIEKKLKNIDKLNDFEINKYLKIGLIMEQRVYVTIFDVINKNPVFFDTFQYNIENILDLLANALEEQHKMFVKEKQQIMSLLKEFEKTNNNKEVFLIEFLAKHADDIMKLRNRRCINNEYNTGKKQSLDVYRRPLEVFFSLVYDPYSEEVVLKIDNIAPIKIFSSRMEAVFNEKSYVDNNKLIIRFAPTQDRLFHTVRMVQNNNNTILNINVESKKNYIDVGKVKLKCLNDDVLIFADNNIFEAVYLSTYDIKNSIILIFLRMISKWQEEVYLPENKSPITKSSNIKYYPYLKYRNVILTARRWYVNIKSFPECRGSMISENGFKNLQEFIQKYNIPRYIYIYTDEENTHKRIIDFYNPFSCIQLKRYYIYKFVWIEEIMMPAKNEQCIQYLLESDG